MRAVAAADRARLRRLMRRHPGLEISPSAASALALARFELDPGARLHIAEGVVTERRPEGVCFHVEAGAEVRVGAGTWLRSDLGAVHVIAFEGAKLHIGPESFLNACHLSAKQEVVLGRRAWIGPGSRVFDSDQHDFDSERPEQSRPVRIGDHVWIASDVTVLKGVPASVRGTVGDRSRTR
jgi:UDP-3-O-[3-hydroxymyristoyl] glucosamine N-acyltransferase